MSSTDLLDAIDRSLGLGRLRRSLRAMTIQQDDAAVPDRWAAVARTVATLLALWWAGAEVDVLGLLPVVTLVAFAVLRSLWWRLTPMLVVVDAVVVAGLLTSTPLSTQFSQVALTVLAGVVALEAGFVAGLWRALAGAAVAFGFLVAVWLGLLGRTVGQVLQSATSILLVVTAVAAGAMARRLWLDEAESRSGELRRFRSALYELSRRQAVVAVSFDIGTVAHDAMQRVISDVRPRSAMVLVADGPGPLQVAATHNLEAPPPVRLTWQAGAQGAGRALATPRPAATSGITTRGPDPSSIPPDDQPRNLPDWKRSSERTVEDPDTSAATVSRAGPTADDAHEPPRASSRAPRVSTDPVPGPSHDPARGGRDDGRPSHDDAPVDHGAALPPDPAPESLLYPARGPVPPTEPVAPTEPARPVEPARPAEPAAPVHEWQAGGGRDPEVTDGSDEFDDPRRAPAAATESLDPGGEDGASLTAALLRRMQEAQRASRSVDDRVGSRFDGDATASGDDDQQGPRTASQERARARGRRRADAATQRSLADLLGRTTIEAASTGRLTAVLEQLAPSLPTGSVHVHGAELDGELMGALIVVDPAEPRSLGRHAEETALALDSVRLFNRLRAFTRDQERARIGRSLHDGVMQTLAHVAFELDRVASDSWDESQVDHLGQLRDHVLGTVDEMRAVVNDLRTVRLDRGLPSALEAMGLTLSPAGGPVIEVSAQQVGSLPGDVEEQFLRVAEEALMNAVRHSGARNVRVSLSRNEGALVLQVVDDGFGFTQARVGADDGGVGLTSMYQRSRSIGAGLDIDTSPNGTIVTLHQPMASTEVTSPAEPPRPTTPESAPRRRPWRRR